ncbi:MAG TPA: SapC family protein [Sphingomicrobium sp.]
MAELEPLNAENHRLLRAGAPVPDGRNFVQIVASEFAAAAAACPILFSKSPDTGQFYAGAMFGFRPEEPSLVIDDAFVPLDVERQAFFISGEYVAIDPEHPRFGAADGQLLFGEDGQPSDRLRRIQRSLAQLNLGVEPTETFIRALLDLKLIEPIDVSLHFDDGETLRLQGLYTIARDSLHELADDEALKLFRERHLQLAYTMLASLEQIPLMAQRRNRRLAQGL